MSYIVAHRGACHFAPENTMSAFRKAVEMGVDGIETDVQITADRKMVIHHNYSVDGTSDRSGKISDMTLAELKTLDFGSYRGKEFAGERIATLEECLEIVRPLKLVNIELKAQEDRSIPYVRMVVDAVKSHDMVEQTVISSFNHSLLAEVKALCPELRTGALTFAPGMDKNPMFGALMGILPGDKAIADISEEDLTIPEEMRAQMAGMKIDITAKSPEAMLLELLQSCVPLLPAGGTCTDLFQWLKQQDDLEAYIRNLDFAVDYLHPDYHSVLMDETLIPRLRKLGVGVSPYTPNEPEELKALWQAGCYSIITNRPDILLQMREGA